MKLLSICLHRCLLVICALSFYLLSPAQDVAFAWGRAVSGNGTIWNLSSTADAAGNVYTAGYFSNTADFDPGPNTMNLTANGYSDAYISKLNTAGNYVWVIQLGGAGGDNINDVEVDDQGNIYVVGASSGADFDPGPGVVNTPGSAFVAKYDPDGHLIWVSGATGGIALAIDASYNIYVVGNGVQVAQNANDAYIAKLSSTGVLQWKKILAGKKEDLGWSVAIDHDGNVIAGGTFLSDTLDIDPGPGVYNVTYVGGSFDSWLLKLDPSGNFIWGGAITAPIFNAGALEAQVDVRSAEQKAAVADYGRIGARAFGEVENALSSAFALEDREAILTESVAANSRALELANVRYRVGVGDLRAVQQQSLALHAARTALLRVQAERLVQRVNLHLALGGSFEQPQYKEGGNQ